MPGTRPSGKYCLTLPGRELSQPAVLKGPFWGEPKTTREIEMNKSVNFGVSCLAILTTGVAFADDFSTTFTGGSSITAQRGAGCGGSTDTYAVQLPSGCSGTIDPDTGNITITNCSFSPSSQLEGFLITLSSNSGSGNYDGTNMTLTPDINVNVTDNPPSGLSCDSATPISATLSGTVTGGSGTISFSGSISGPTFSVTPTCPPSAAATLNCVLQTVTGATFNLTIP